MMGVPAWHERAVCRQIGTEAFYTPDQTEPFKSPSERMSAAREAGVLVRAAKKVCKTCPVLAECRESAYANREEYGVWGGEGERERTRSQRWKDRT